MNYRSMQIFWRYFRLKLHRPSSDQYSAIIYPCSNSFTIHSPWQNNIILKQSPIISVIFVTWEKRRQKNLEKRYDVKKTWKISKGDNQSIRIKTDRKMSLKKYANIKRRNASWYMILQKIRHWKKVVLFNWVTFLSIIFRIVGHHITEFKSSLCYRKIPHHQHFLWGT